MRTLLFVLLLCISPCAAFAQSADPLAVTLPNGKVVRFQSEEQRAKFEAAQARKAAVAVQATPAPTPGTRAKLGSSLDAPSGLGGGIVNQNAPPFTANYYLLAPASWAGKKVTLAVAYLQPHRGAERADGKVEMAAATYNRSVTTSSYTDYGGTITVLAKPEIATRLMQQCGTSIQYGNGWYVKSTMVRGEISKLENSKGEEGSGVSYGFLVTE